MPSPGIDPDAAPDVDFFGPSLQRLAQGCTLREFCDWFAQRFAGAFPGAAGVGSEQPMDAESSRRIALVMARMIWQRVPDPADGWRVRGLPQLSRNDPCYCGSGRKYKQCCQSLTQSAPPLELDSVTLGGGLVAEGPAALREAACLRRMPGLMLAAAAHQWRDKGGAAGVVQLLEPVFLEPRGLGAAHEEAFDVLMDAMLEEGLQARREQLARTVATQASDRRLRSTAHCRLATILSDRGEFPQAWESFHAARRDDPDDPQQLHLELVLLLSEGRLAEAKARTPLLAARARKLGYDELAEALVDIERAGPDALRHRFAPADEQAEQAWVGLLRAPLPHLDAQRFVALQPVTVLGEGAELRIEPTRQAKRSLAPWTRRFGTVLPALTALHAAADELLDEPDEAREWLAAHPKLCASVPVLDDLLIAARAMEDEGAGRAVAQAAAELACAAADLLVAACEPWPQARIEWVDHKNRPALRLVAQAIDRALALGDDARAVRWMRWMLARNPHDNHGWREVLRTLLLRDGDAAGALVLLDAYPDDAPPAGHDRALALFISGRRDAAEAALRAEHAAFPAFAQALLPPLLDRPAGGQDGFYEFGGADHAWNWRQHVREIWVKSGALEWLRGLQLPADPSSTRLTRTRSGGNKASRARKPPEAASRANEDAGLEVLRRCYGERLPWLLGWLAGSAWAPEMVMPSAWVTTAVEQAVTDRGPDRVQELLQALMNRYNAFNEQRLAGAPGEPVPLPDELAAGDDAAWTGFAAGFVQFAEQHAAGAWRAAGATLRSGKGLFAPLYQLAALAPAGPDSWRATGDEAQPLLALAGDQPRARDLLAAALLPLWRLSLDARF